jgi:ribonuclease BN (tRNA processing enzyme)
MKLKILGTGTATPSLQRVPSSYLLLTRWGTILVDIGPSVVRRMLECGYAANDVDMIILTHFHPDHTVDLATFLFACNYGEVTRKKPLFLLGGRGIERFFRNFVRLYRWLSPVGYELTLKSLPACAFPLDGLSVLTCRVSHNPESIGVRVDESGSVVFTGDTGYAKDLVALAAGADLLVAECSFPERKVRGHLNLADVQRIIRKAKPRQVILSHLYPDWDTFEGVLRAPLVLGVDGLEVEL